VTCGRLVVFSTNETDLHNVTEILLKVALNNITLTLNVPEFVLHGISVTI
jgi:hypothetical protein